jgi:predicted Zn-dependent peptidase
MVFKGSACCDSRSFWEKIEGSGGSANGFTDRDATCLHCTVPLEDWRQALKLMVDAVFNAQFPREEFEKERQVILSEILQVEDDIDESAFDAFLSCYWKDQPPGWSIAGLPGQVRKISRDALYDFYRRHFTPENALFAVSGDLDAMELEVALVEALQDSGEAPAALPALRSETPRPSARSCFCRADSSQAIYLRAAQLDPPFGEKDFPTLAILNGMLGDSSSSRIFVKVREELGLAYSVQTSCGFSPTEALFAVQAAADPTLLDPCRNAILSELDRFFGECSAEKPASQTLEDEMHRTARRLSGAFLLSLEDPEVRIRRLAGNYLLTGKVPGAREEAQAFSQVTFTDLAAMAARLRTAVWGEMAYGNLDARECRSMGFKEFKHG